MPVAPVLGDFEALASRVGSLARQRRSIVAIAGPPTSGKSTLAARLQCELETSLGRPSSVLPADGFHYDDGLLRDMEMLKRKGAPQTFDVGGLKHMLNRLRLNAEPQIAVPVFDRDLEISRAGARLIPASIEIVIVEGNYLLVDAEPWNDLHGYFDLSIMLSVAEEELARRIRSRWEHYGLSEDAIRWKLYGNDLPNCAYVMANSRQADLVYESSDNENRSVPTPSRGQEPSTKLVPPQIK